MESTRDNYGTIDMQSGTPGNLLRQGDPREAAERASVTPHREQGAREAELAIVLVVQSLEGVREEVKLVVVVTLAGAAEREQVRDSAAQIWASADEATYEVEDYRPFLQGRKIRFRFWWD